MSKKRPQPKSPKKRRGTGPTGAQRQEQRRQRLEQRRRERAEALQREARRRRLRRVVRLATIAALSVLVLAFFWSRATRTTSIRGHEVELLSQGVPAAAHRAPPIQYDTDPPVSGAHAPQPAPCGTHADPLVTEQMVHTLEHGAVGILFGPSLDPETVGAIERLVREYDSHVFSAPYEALDSPITVVSWGERMPLDDLDPAAVRDYIDEFGRSAPEDLDCDLTVDQQFEPAPAPTGSPSPEPTRTKRSGRAGG